LLTTQEWLALELDGFYAVVGLGEAERLKESPENEISAETLKLFLHFLQSG
jgi:hypothetical protein